MALRQSVGDLGATLISALKTRLALFSLEAADQRSHLIRLIALTLGGVLCVALALLVFTLLVALYFWPTEHRYLALALLGSVYGLGGFVLLWVVRNAVVNAPAPFSATIDELRRDAALFDRLRGPPRASRRDGQTSSEGAD